MYWKSFIWRNFSKSPLKEWNFDKFIREQIREYHIGACWRQNGFIDFELYRISLFLSLFSSAMLYRLLFFFTSVMCLALPPKTRNRRLVGNYTSKIFHGGDTSPRDRGRGDAVPRRISSDGNGQRIFDFGVFWKGIFGKYFFGVWCLIIIFFIFFIFWEGGGYSKQSQSQEDSLKCPPIPTAQ